MTPHIRPLLLIVTISQKSGKIHFHAPFGALILKVNLAPSTNYFNFIGTACQFYKRERRLQGSNFWKSRQIHFIHFSCAILNKKLFQYCPMLI